MTRVLSALLLLLSVSPVLAREILTPDGLAPVKIGMTVKQAQKMLGAKLDIGSDASGDEAMCSQANRPGDNGVGYMFHNYRVVRIDIGRNDIDTPEGAGIGSSEADLRRLYGRRAAFTPHPYDNEHGHYVTVHFPGRNRTLIFETLDGKVTSFRIGIPGAAELIEGCA